MFRLISKYESRTFYKQNFDSLFSKFNALTLSCRYKSYYHTLELNSTASAKDIKTAYYKLSLQHHPDKNNGSDESVIKFREITEAYEVLSNPETKRKYDQEYSFEPQYSSRSYQTGRYYRPTSSQGQQTGKTKDFDYEEHFKKHYQDYQKQREAEFEYFRRRWEAEFYRRYPTAEHYYRNRHKHKDDEPSQELLKRISARKRIYFIICAFWTFVLLLSIVGDSQNPDRRSKNNGPIYYNSRKEDTTESRLN